MIEIWEGTINIIGALQTNGFGEIQAGTYFLPVTTDSVLGSAPECIQIYTPDAGEQKIVPMICKVRGALLEFSKYAKVALEGNHAMVAVSTKMKFIIWVV
jgi:hypothetical protein